MPRKTTLTTKESAFVDNLTTNGGQKAKAAKDAGFSQRFPHVLANQLLKKPLIAEEVQRRLAKAAEHANVKREQIAGTLAMIATSSLTDVLNENGELDWKLAKERGNDHLIKEVVVTERHSKDGSSRVTTTYKMDDRIRAADLLSELMGWKREPAKNPLDLAKEMLEILRVDPKFAEMDEAMLRSLVAARLQVNPADLQDLGTVG